MKRLLCGLCCLSLQVVARGDSTSDELKGNWTDWTAWSALPAMVGQVPTSVRTHYWIQRWGNRKLFHCQIDIKNDSKDIAWISFVNPENQSEVWSGPYMTFAGEIDTVDWDTFVLFEPGQRFWGIVNAIKQ
jgi:hypothetical protein